MHKRIQSATVSTQEETPAMEFSPGVNILCGQTAGEILLTLSGIFGGMPMKAFKAALNWQDDVTLFVSGEDGQVFVDGIKGEKGDPAQLMKAFHKQRFLNFRNNAHLLDGSRLPDGFSGASDLLLKKLCESINKKNDYPLFICNFLERLDEAIDLRPILEALLTTGRQVFISVPRCYDIKTLEEIHNGMVIETD